MWIAPPHKHLVGSSDSRVWISPGMTFLLDSVNVWAIFERDDQKAIASEM
jgi:hypothetical protein